MSKLLLQQGLDALDTARSTAMHNTIAARVPECGDFGAIAQTIDYVMGELRAAIAAPEPEPVGHLYTIAGVQHCSINRVLEDGPLYAAPPDTEALRKELDRVKGERDAMAARLNWLQRHIFGHSWNGVIDSGSRTNWTVWSGYRHETAKMIGDTFEAAIDAAIAAQGDTA